MRTSTVCPEVRVGNDIMIHRITLLTSLYLAAQLVAGTGDPQVKTDHPWYPGELALSTFERLFATQAAVYERVTGRKVESDEDKALASWLWRNTHYWHEETARRDLWGEGLNQGKDRRLREYWNGLFGYGFGLCGTTHSQWTAEMQYLLGHGRGRGVGAAAHNAFEVFLTGGEYGDGRWALLDHDLSTVVFDTEGKRLLSLGEMQEDLDRWIDRAYRPERQRGWLVCGLHPSDGNSYRKFAVAEYLAGYAGPPPMVHLRRGERMRRYFEPGLEDGQTFVFWGRNGNAGNIPGPERSRTWVNQPDRMHGSREGTPHLTGQARYANVEVVYRPDFASGDYREGVVEESGDAVVFEFRTPYIIGASPPDDSEWGVYKEGCRNGLVLRGKAECAVSLSLDAGRSWVEGGPFVDGLDLTDHVKGRAHYWIRLGASAAELKGSDLEMQTVCQANVAVMPRLKDGRTTIHYEASHQAVVSMGPEAGLVRSFVTKGGFGETSLTLTTPSDLKGETIAIYAAAHVASSNPPNPDIRYQIEYSLTGGEAWIPLVEDWTVPRMGEEPAGFWSQSFCYGKVRLETPVTRPIQIRFHNNGGKRYLRAEAHVVQQLGHPMDPVKVTYRWIEDGTNRKASHVFPGEAARQSWNLATGKNVRTISMEMTPLPSFDG